VREKQSVKEVCEAAPDVCMIASAMGKGIVYTADDRSLLLPWYKRFLVEPTLPFIPARVHPNTITHTGHLLCLAAIALLVAGQPTRGWMFIASMVLVQVYMWCDNADGAHARRTKQSSATGEFLDHGLDLLNTTYIGLMTAFALGSSPAHLVMWAILVPGAAALTCWEQTETGVFRIGLLNQIESVTVLSFTMVVSAVYGNGVWRTIHLGPITAYDFFHYWPAVTILFGEVRRLWRVRGVGHAVAPALAFLALQSTVALVYSLGHISAVVAAGFAIVATLFLGLRALSLRLQSTTNRVEPLFLVGIVGLLGYAGACRAGMSCSHSAGVALAVLSLGVCSLFSVNEARLSLNNLARLEPGRG